MREKAVEICIVAAFVFAFLFLFALHPTVTPVAAAYPASDSVSSTLLITELYPNTAMRNEPDEYVALTNFGSYPVNLEGWRITDTEGTIIFPPFEVVSNQTVYVTRNASAFTAQMSAVSGKDVVPDFEYGSDSDPTVIQLQTEGRAFALRNTGDEVILQDETGGEVDVIIYGEETYEDGGWQGEPLEKPREGMIFIRRGAQDTNQREDWLSLPFGASYHAPEKFSCSGSGSATAFVSPDCSFSVLQSELNNASSSLCINLYQFDNPYLMDLVLDALNRGVTVKLLLEGSPVGGSTDEELYIAETIRERGGEVRLSHDSYINHAKYALIDNKTLIAMTENWKTTGVPTNNSFGNRGWGIVLKNDAVANYFTEVFIEDFYRAEEFVSELEDLEVKEITRAIPQSSYVPVFEPRTVTCDFTGIPVLAPDTALSNETILGTIQSAQESVLVQQFSAARSWGEEDNTFITALIEAARRGCEVKVLLDSKDYNLDTWNDNDEAVAWLEQVASEEHLDLEAKLADLDSLGLTKVHTKGLIVDGEIVIITSLNWNPNSAHNREAGVIVENEEIASFFEDVFFHDWNASVNGKHGGEAEGEATGERGWRTPTKLKVVGVTVTLILSFVVFRIVKWYKRL